MPQYCAGFCLGFKGIKGRISGYAILDATQKPDQKTKEMGPLFISMALTTELHGQTQTFFSNAGICKDHRGPKVVTEEDSLSNPGSPRGGKLLGQMIFYTCGRPARTRQWGR